MTDWDDGRRDVARRPAQLPEGHARRIPARARARFTTTLQVRAGDAAASSPTTTTGRRGAPSPATSTLQLRRSEPTGDYRGRATIHERHGQDPGVPAVPDGHAVALQPQRREGALRPHRPRERRRADGRDRRRRPRALARADSTTSKSRIDFPTQKDIFFHGQKFGVSGAGDFTGTFHLFKGGRELKGTFVSAVAGVNDWRFPNLRGSVLWVPDRLEITDATSELYGGTARFDYRMAPLGQPTPATRRRGTWSTRTSISCGSSDFLEIEGLRLAGRASGRNRLEWPLGKWALEDRRGRSDASRRRRTCGP